MRSRPSLAIVATAFAALAVAAVAGCKSAKKAASAPAEGAASAATAGPARDGKVKVGLVTDVGGRGDQSFNDGALRGLEAWAAGVRYTARGYQPLPSDERLATIPASLRRATPIEPLPIEPVVVSAKQQEDYEPNLELLVDEGCQLAVGVGFMLENAVETAAHKHPTARFLLIDSPILDAQGKPYELPNVKTLSFRENEGTFLVGALAGMVTRTGVVGFVGGMQIPLIRRFEAGFRAGVMTTNPEAAKKLLVGYTGSFDRVQAGKQVAQDMIAKGADVLFHGAGHDGLGVIAAAQEAGRWAIGCDSDQRAVAPGTILTSMLKRVDLAVYLAAREVVENHFQPGHRELGLSEGALGYAPINEQLPEAERYAARLDALAVQIVAGTLKVPSTPEGLAAFQPPAAEAGHAAP